jgi:hypothetical protein
MLSKRQKARSSPFRQTECDDKFKFDRAFMAWLVDRAKKTMGDVHRRMAPWSR